MSLFADNRVAITIIDAGKNFISKEFINNASSILIKVYEVPIEAYNSISKVKRYYTIIRRAFKVITVDLSRTALLDYIL